VCGELQCALECSGVLLLFSSAPVWTSYSGANLCPAVCQGDWGTHWKYSNTDNGTDMIGISRETHELGWGTLRR